MAIKKAGASVKNGRDSYSKRLGVKIFGGQKVSAGSIIVRQVGMKFKCGKNVYCGRDYTIHALINGIVTFSSKFGVKFVSVFL